MSILEFERLASWTDFESLILSLYQRKEPNYTFSKYGRSGQKQDGVDIVGLSGFEDLAKGIQCKRLQEGALDEATVVEELEKSDKFVFPLSCFIIATTIRRDTKIQKIEFSINEKRKNAGKHLVKIVFWDDIIEWLNEPENIDITRRFYPASFLEVSSKWITESVVNLERNHYALGDRKAANFPFVIAPIKSIWDNANNKMADLCQSEIKTGILITGQANSGKTRLALELILANCKNRHLITLTPADLSISIPPMDTFAERSIILFIDDLQKFVPQISNVPSLEQIGWSKQAPLAEMLLLTISKFHAIASSVIVVGTFRQEEEKPVRAIFGTLFLTSYITTVPSFSKDPLIAENQKIFDAFSSVGEIDTKDWDGNIGSLVLGLEKKREQYAQWAHSAHPSLYVLHAMKLLSFAMTPLLTQSRLQIICADVFGQTLLRESHSAWQSTLDELVVRGFVLEPETSSNPSLKIAKDDYLESIVDDYPPLGRLSRLEADLICLQNSFIRYKDAEVLCNLVAYRNVNKQYEPALLLTDEAITIEPKFWQVWNNRGNALHGLKRYEEALVAYEQAIELAPSVATIWNNKAAVYGDMKLFKQALEAAENSIIRDPHNATAYVNKGTTLSELGNTSEAIKTLEIALGLDPSITMGWHNLSVICIESTLYNKALFACEEAIKCDPSFEPPFVNKVIILSWLERFDDAKRAICQISENSTYYVKAWFYHGAVFLNKHMFHEALDSFDHVLAINPNDADAIACKGGIYCDLGEYDKGLELCKSAVRIDENNARVWITLGNVHRILGEREGEKNCYERALVSYETAIKIDPDLIDAWVGKGLSLLVLGNLRLAIIAFDHALSLNPNHEIALKGHEVVTQRIMESELRA